MIHRVPVPSRREDDVPLARILRAILESDQLDDWVPDAAYFRDELADLDETLRRITAKLDEKSADLSGIRTVKLPRRSGDPVTALVLPLDVRVLFHSAVARIAPQILPALPRDKVYGSGFHRQGERLFDAAGAERDHLFDVLRDAATESKLCEELEVLGLDETSVDDLMKTLHECGAAEEESALVSAVLSHAGEHVPYADDAMAFLANFQLQPVDRSLLRDRRNFFRSGARYFVVDDDARKALMRALKERGLEARTVSRRERGDTPRLESDPPEDVDGLFRLDPDAAPLDAFEVLPRLRTAHRSRLDSALETPAGEEGGETLLRFRKQIGQGRPWLRRALGTAVRDRSSWQAWWTSMLLSDTGTLDEPETTLLLDVIADPELSDLAKMQARLTLARSSETPPDRYWEDPPPPPESTHHTRRALFVASAFLAKRYPEIWEETKDREGGREPRLAHLLLRKLQEKRG